MDPKVLVVNVSSRQANHGRRPSQLRDRRGPDLAHHEPAHDLAASHGWVMVEAIGCRVDDGPIRDGVGT